MIYNKSTRMYTWIWNKKNKYVNKKKRNRVPVIYFCLIFHSNQIELSLIMNTKTKMIIKWYGWEHLKKNASLISLNTVHHNYVWILMTKPKFDCIFINSHYGIRVYIQLVHIYMFWCPALHETGLICFAWENDSSIWQWLYPYH